MIILLRQDCHNQYDQYDRPISYWDYERGAWIVSPEYEEEFLREGCCFGNTAGCETLSDWEQLQEELYEALNKNDNE